MADHAPVPTTVFLRPAWASENVFCAQIADALTAAGLNVKELGFGVAAVPLQRGVIFLHWPNEMFILGGWRSSLRTIAKLVRVAWGKWRHDQRLVWMVHNAVPHERGQPFTVARRMFFRLLDGLVFLSESSREIVISRYPELGHQPFVVVPHGLYPAQGCLAAAGTVPRERPVRLVFAGRVKRYKSPEALAATVATLPSGEVELVIAGACDEQDLRRELEEIAKDAENVRLDLRFLDDATLEALLDFADAVVLPYRDILNSGSALHALSRYRPFIGPRLGSLLELRQQVGENWVWLYEGPFSRDVLVSAVGWLRARAEGGHPDLSGFEWHSIGGNLAAFIRRIDEGSILATEFVD